LESFKRVIAVYDANKCPVTYDFVVFASMAKTYARGRPLHFVFVPRPDGTFAKPNKFNASVDLNRAECEYRFRHIVLESVPLFGATFTVCPDREFARTLIHGDVYPVGYTLDKPVFDYQNDGVVRTFQEFGPLVGPEPSERAIEYVSKYLDGKKRVVSLTLRQSRFPIRNSNIDAWSEYIAERTDCHFVIVPDTDKAFKDFRPGFMTQASVSVDIRLALYKLADLNCFTSNGCGALIWFSDKPYLFFKAGADGYMTKEQWDKLLIPYGTQPPFIRKNQKWVWEDDNLENIRKAVRAVLN
jgi:hypothetical protein